MSVREHDDPDLFDMVQRKNLVRQYDLLLDCIQIGLEKGIEAFDKYTLWSLNAAAVSNIAQFGGRYRKGPIYVGDHVPPHFDDVPDEMDRFLSVIHENWTVIDNPLTLAAYALWRMNWIHPFVEGNGRTARAACYYLICLKHGATTAWQQDRSRADSRGQEAVLCGFKGCRYGLGARALRRERAFGLSG